MGREARAFFVAGAGGGCRGCKNGTGFALAPPVAGWAREGQPAENRSPILSVAARPLG